MIQQQLPFRKRMQKLYLVTLFLQAVKPLRILHILAYRGISGENLE